MNNNKIIRFLLSLIICLVFTEANGVYAAERKVVQEGQQANDFTLKTVEGKTVSLSEYKGKIVVMNFWTTWCTYCQEEMEELNKFSEEMQSVNVELLGVNVTSSEENERAVIQFVNHADIPYRVGMDVNGEVSKSYNIIGIPTTFIIDEKGIVRKKILGPVTSNLLKEAILHRKN
ncbi:TlpA disulfide reductase family protein [Bacillus sp. SA1-12]|uniref:TlpA disulfide reductase family protein n=1 Tax=Bacillus sp. SA1-12 TaxID=1455638 RepID=UPI000696D396|nr:TlpA disulfide reductase family protein [Bacillus sp. SA1-12]